MDAVTHVPVPINEPVLTYAPGTPERDDVQAALARLGTGGHDLPMIIDGARVDGTGRRVAVRQPHAHAKVLGHLRTAGVAQA
ncbi:MAG: 1-pyrroline-5-carboxylate dehydrogenase, partial [Nostocoides sp.]